MKYSRDVYEKAIRSLAELREAMPENERQTLDFVVEAIAEKGDREYGQGHDLGEPLTLEQLREMVGRWVWVVVNYDHDGEQYQCDGWALVPTPAFVSYLDQMIPIDFYEKKFLAYAYPPAHIDSPCHVCGYGGKHLDAPPCTSCPAHPKKSAHIDREAWTGCVCNTSIKSCCTCISMECHSCIGESKYKRGRYCSSCGRPLTEEAWAMLEKRLRGCAE